MTIGLPFGWAKAAGLGPNHKSERTARKTTPNLSHLSIAYPPCSLFFEALGPRTTKAKAFTAESAENAEEIRSAKFEIRNKLE
jgi:hypothetical protein